MQINSRSVARFWTLRRTFVQPCDFHFFTFLIAQIGLDLQAPFRWMNPTNSTNYQPTQVAAGRAPFLIESERSFVTRRQPPYYSSRIFASHLWPVLLRESNSVLLRLPDKLARGLGWGWNWASNIASFTPFGSLVIVSCFFLIYMQWHILDDI